MKILFYFADKVIFPKNYPGTGGYTLNSDKNLLLNSLISLTLPDLSDCFSISTRNLDSENVLGTVRYNIV